MSPSNKVTTSVQAQQFRWGLVPGATSYNIQIVSPSFDSLASTTEDVFVVNDTFKTTLAPGKYQWKVTAVNSISTSRSEVFSLTVIADSTRDLRRQTLLLSLPNNGFTTNIKTQTLSWQKLEAAKEYRVQIASPDFTSASNIKIDRRVTNDTISAVLEEGSYRWRVRAENDQTNTDYAERLLIIDVTAPTAPTLLNPLIDSLSDLPVVMRWRTSATDWERDTLYVYGDSAATKNITLLPLTTQTYSFKDTTASVSYYWQVRSVDKAGNTSSYSPLWRFKIRK